MRAGAVGRVVVDDEDAEALRRGRAQHATRGGDDRLEVLGLVEGGQDEPGRVRTCEGRSLGPYGLTPMPDPSNATIAAAFDELGDLYELDGAVVHRVLAYRNAAKAVREAPVSVARADARGHASPSCPASARRSRRSSTRCSRPGRSRPPRSCARKFPPGLVDMTRLPGPRAQAGAQALRRARRSTRSSALRAAAEGQKLRDVQGLRRRSSRSRCSPRFAAGVGETAGAARAAAQGARGRRRDRRGAARAPGRRCASSSPGRRGGWPTPSRTSTSSHASDDPPRAGRGARRRSTSSRARRRSGENAARGADPQRPGGRPARRRARPVRQPAAALHGLARQHNVALREARGAHAGCTSPSTGSSTTRPARRCAARPRRRSTQRLGLPWIPPELREDRGELEPGYDVPDADRRRTSSGRPALPHGRLRRAQHDARRWRAARWSAGYEYVAITDHSATHGFGNDVTPDALQRQIELVREIDERARRHPRARRDRDQHPARRLARLRRRAARPARLGRRLGPHVVRDVAGRDDRADRRGDRASAGSTRSATRPGARSSARSPTTVDIDARHRGRGARRDDARDQLRARPPRPQRRPRARRAARPA